jgi:hypothetical protein
VAGKKGRSGRPPLQVSLHLLRGTYRPDRHAARVTGGSAAPATVLEPIPSSLAVGLGEAGLRVVADLWENYSGWPAEKVTLLHQVGVVVDALAEYEAIVQRDGRIVVTPRGAEAPHPILRVQGTAQKNLLALLAALGLKEE